MPLPEIASFSVSLVKYCADYCDVARRHHYLYEIVEKLDASAPDNSKVAAMRRQLSGFERQLCVLFGRICMTSVQDQESVIALSEVLRFRLAQCPSEGNADAVLLLRLLAGIHHLFPAPNGFGAKPVRQSFGEPRAKRSARKPRGELPSGTELVDVGGPQPVRAA